jgi:hypothetical protein
MDPLHSNTWNKSSELLPIVLISLAILAAKGGVWFGLGRQKAAALQLMARKWFISDRNFLSVTEYPAMMFTSRESR